MKKLITIISAIALVSVSTFASAGTEQSKPGEAGRTVMKKVVRYNCDGKRVKVTYGFNRQGLPTYAQAFLNGKTRYMPINLNLSDNVDTVFGDDNNFSLSSSAITSRKYHSPMQVQSPASEIIYKSCSAR